MILSFLIMLVILIFPFKIVNGDFLSKKNMNHIKAVAVVMIIVTHCVGYYEGYNSATFYVLNNIGFLGVGIFYFSSGYGLMCSHINNENYLKLFWKKRLFNVLVPFWGVNVIYIIFSVLLEGNEYSFAEIVKYILGVELICPTLWYIRVILIFYIVFWCSCKLIPDKKMQMILLMIVFTVFNVFIRGEISVFIIGLILAYIGADKLKIIIDKNFKKIVGIAILVFVLSYIGYMNIFFWNVPYINHSLMYVITQSAFVLLCVLSTAKIDYNSGAIKFVGLATYEIYLLHRLVLDLLDYGRLNVGIFMIAGIVFSAIIGVCYSKIYRMLLRERNI